MAPRSAAPPSTKARAATPSPTTSHAPATLRRETARGALTTLPLLLGYLPFALLIGVAAGDSTNPFAAWSGALLIFGGSAHLSVIELVGDGSSLATAVGTGLLINARLAVYSASLLPLWRGAPVRHRLLAAAAVIDPMLVVAGRRAAQPGTTDERRAFFAGAAATLALGWSAMMGLGVLVGAHQSATAFLGICIPLCLSAIVAPHLRTTGGVRCVAAAGVVAAVTSSWPSGTGLLMAMAAGAVAGGWRTRRVGS